MLNILLGEENRPIDNFIYDVEKITYAVGIPDTVLSRYLLKELECATYLDTNSFIDKDGYKLPVTFMSNGLKILLAVEYSGKCINGIELGQNAFEFLIQSISGTIYFKDVDRFQLPEYFNLSNMSVNGNVFNTVLELEDYLWKEE